MADLRTELATPRSMSVRTPPSIYFGCGMLEREIRSVIADYAAERPLIVTDRGVAATGLPERLRRILADSGVECGLWEGLEPDPDEGVVERCRERIEAAGHDAVLAVGGGSVIDAAKVAAALVTNGGRVADHFGFDSMTRPGRTLVVVPTTAGSGAEVSSHAVITEVATRRKNVVGGIHLVARAAVIDPLTTLTLPAEQTVHSAADGFVHAIEAFVARRGTPVTDAFARLAVPLITAALPRVLADEADPDAREELGLGCLYASLAMANANAGAIHALGFPLTAGFGIPHGLANALMAAAAVERLWPARPERYAELASLMGAGGAQGDEAAARLAPSLRRFLDQVRVTDTLADWGVTPSDLPGLAAKAAEFRPILDNTPMRLTADDLLDIYRSVGT